MLASLIASIGKWILGLLIAAIACIIALPIGLIGWSMNQGIRKHSEINKAIKTAKNQGNIIDQGKVQKLRESANSDIRVASSGMFIMLVIYVLIFLFIPRFFLTSLLGLIPLILGTLGVFLVPDIDL